MYYLLVYPGRESLHLPRRRIHVAALVVVVPVLPAKPLSGNLLRPVTDIRNDVTLRTRHTRDTASFVVITAGLKYKLCLLSGVSSL